MINVLIGLCLICAMAHFLGYQIKFGQGGLAWENSNKTIRYIMYTYVTMIAFGYVGMLVLLFLGLDCIISQIL